MSKLTLYVYKLIDNLKKQTTFTSNDIDTKGAIRLLQLLDAIETPIFHLKFSIPFVADYDIEFNKHM